MIFNSQEELDAALAKWQKILRLQDWDVKARICRQSQLGADEQGHIETTVATKAALITLLDPRDFPEDSKWEQDHEQCLVHELLHMPMQVLERAIGYDTWKDTDAVYIAKEQFIDLTATALVALDRASRPVSQGVSPAFVTGLSVVQPSPPVVHNDEQQKVAQNAQEVN